MLQKGFKIENRNKRENEKKTNILKMKSALCKKSFLQKNNLNVHILRILDTKTLKKLKQYTAKPNRILNLKYLCV